jgi:kinesin family protein C2/C3
MEGLDDGQDMGISSRTIQKLLNLLQHKALNARQASRENQAATDGSSTSDSPDRAESFKYEVKISMLEIYNDEVYDLLTPSTASDYKGKNTKKDILDVRRNKNGDLEVHGLTKVKVQSLQDVASSLKVGHENRATATTNMNEHSSRSHMVLKVEVSSVSQHEMNVGNLYLVDLAGSERVAKSEVAGQELKEAGHINKSLSALGNVMEALDRKSSHIPYRDSKLTYLLQDSLGGNSRTMMVVTVCPNSSSIDETICALQFAQRVRRIHLGSAQKNVQNKNLEEIIKNMTAEMKLLTKAKEISEEQLHEMRRDHTRIQERLRSNAANSEKNNTDGSRTTAYLRSSHAEITARWQKEKKKFEESCSDLERTQNEVCPEIFLFLT